MILFLKYKFYNKNNSYFIIIQKNIINLKKFFKIKKLKLKVISVNLSMT